MQRIPSPIPQVQCWGFEGRFRFAKVVFVLHLFALQNLIRANIELRGAGGCQPLLDIAFVFFGNTGSAPKRNEYNAKYIAVLKFARAV